MSTFKKSFNRAKLDEKKLQVFNAINGNEITDYNGHLTKGELGCLESHLAVLKDAVAKKYQSIIILEDDITFCKGFEKKLKVAMSELPQYWDLLYLYSTHYVRPIKFSSHLNKCVSTLSTVAYMVDQKYYQSLINLIEQRDNQIDVIYAHQHGTNNAFATTTNLCLHYDGFSDVNFSNTKYKLSLTSKIFFFIKRLLRIKK